MDHFFIIFFILIILEVFNLAMSIAGANLGSDNLGLSDLNMGIFGDFIGGTLNPILASFTLMGMLFTIHRQREELKISEEQFKKTDNSTAIQLFETTLFNLVGIHNGIYQALLFDVNEIANGERIIHGENISNSFLEYCRNAGIENKVFSGRSVFNIILRFICFDTGVGLQAEDWLYRYGYLQKEKNEILGHYFRNLYQLLKLIDSCKSIDSHEKKKYASIIRAQLSSQELALLLVNCTNNMCDDGKFKQLIITYEFLEHLPITAFNDGFKACSNLYLSESTVMQYIPKEHISSSTAINGLSRLGAFGLNPGVQQLSKRAV